MQNIPRVVSLLATGGTIAGTSTSPSDHLGYRAAQIGVAELLAAVPALAGVRIDPEQVAQLDSKDTDHSTWRRLAEHVAQQLDRDDVCGVVITHGTDTLEETAYFLQRVLAPCKPVVLTGAMRPATALQSDGPQNLLDAVSVAQTPGASGTVVVMAGVVHRALAVRKVHTHRLDAFDSGDAGPVGHIEAGHLRLHRAWPAGTALGLAWLPAEPDGWPRVEIVVSRAGASGEPVRALRAAGVQGIVVAGTGNGTLHLALEAALREAQAAGIAVLRCSRCLGGPVIDAGDAAPGLASAGALTPVQARIELMLRMLVDAA